MLFSSYGSIILNEDAIKIFGDYLGFPNYFIQFTGIAKVLGVIAILIPGFPGIKEWAYAGLAFDLIGAVYSGLAVGGFDPMMLTMLIWIIPGVLSYYFYHKMNKAVFFEAK